MKSLLRLLSVFVLTGIFASNVWADKPKAILQLKDLEPGTKAIGFSVFKGVEPEPFDVVLGGQIDYMGNNLILSRVSGGPMETPLEEIGAISGMSGSPVFIGCINKELSEEEQLKNCVLNGTLVGSTSYGPGFFIKGGTNFLLTPAEYMLGARAGGYVTAAGFYHGLPNKISVGGQDYYNLMLFPKMENMSVAGNSDGRCKESVKSDIRPGSMVSVLLATGTVNVGASGTVTWRDGNDIYVFGHPFLGTGLVRYPFIQVSVADTLQTPFGASKLSGCYLDVRGTILVDGAFEMSGVIGVAAPMLPYQVELRMGDGGAVMTEEIATSPMAPAIMKQLPISWAQQLLGDVSRFPVAYQSRISIADQPEIFVRNIVPAQARRTHTPVSEDKSFSESKVTNRTPFEEVFDRIYGSLQAMKGSGFKYGIEGIKVRLEVMKDLGLWTSKKSFLSQEKASPGETVYVNVVLEDLTSSAVKQMSIPVKVPEDFMDRVGPGVQSSITVLVQGGSKFTDKSGSPEATSVEEFIKQLNQSMNYKTNVLYVQQIMPRSKAEQKDDEAKAKASVKPPWKWTDVGESDLKQFSRNDKNDVVLTFSPPLDNFVDLNLTFNLPVQAKDPSVNDKKETKKKKRFLLF